MCISAFYGEIRSSGNVGRACLPAWHFHCQLPAPCGAGALLLTPTPIPGFPCVTYPCCEGLGIECGKQEAQGWGALAPSSSRGALAPLQSTEVLARLRNPRGQRLLNPLVLIFIYKGGLTGLWEGGMGATRRAGLASFPECAGPQLSRQIRPAHEESGEVQPRGALFQRREPPSEGGGHRRGPRWGSGGQGLWTH